MGLNVQNLRYYYHFHIHFSIHVDSLKSLQSYERLNLSFRFIHSSFIDYMQCLPKVNLYLKFILKQKNNKKVLSDSAT